MDNKEAEREVQTKRNLLWTMKHKNLNIQVHLPNWSTCSLSNARRRKPDQINIVINDNQQKVYNAFLFGS